MAERLPNICCLLLSAKWLSCSLRNVNLCISNTEALWKDSLENKHRHVNFCMKVFGSAEIKMTHCISLQNGRYLPERTEVNGCNGSNGHFNLPESTVLGNSWKTPSWGSKEINIPRLFNTTHEIQPRNFHSIFTHLCFTSLCPEISMKAQVGWKAPVPQA